MQKATAAKAKSKGANRVRSAQDLFLTQMVNERTKVAMFLVNGIRLEGEIASFDQHVILLKGAVTENVYKHAVSTIQPVADVASAKKRSIKEYPARAAAMSGAGAAGDAEHADSSAAAVAAEDKPRQPVIVVRAKRRSIKSP